jgi:4a-hydroxytetrahydrobiopterin dehydratase
MQKLTEKKCVPCEGGVQPFNKEQIQEYLGQLSGAWEVKDGKKITKRFKFHDFKEAMVFVNKIADLAEQEGHHPDIRVFGYKNVEIELSTHAISGLSENDFILAAKIEPVYPLDKRLS